MNNIWHKFPDVIPPKNKSVLVINDYWHPPACIIAFHSLDFGWHACESKEQKLKVLYWMELPEFPPDIMALNKTNE